MTLSLDKSFIKAVNDGISEVLSSKLMKFEPSVNGVLLNRENTTRVSLMSELPEDVMEVQSFQVLLQSNFYVFAPRLRTPLDVTVLTVGSNSATAKALGRFKVV